MDLVLTLVKESVEKVLLAFIHNWPYLLASILIAVVLKLYVDTRKVAAFLQRFRGVGVAAATAAAVTTPLCSCGTTAIVLGMMATTMPWAPIVAFMVASPLSSPEGLVYSAGLFGWPFAAAFFASSVILGLAGGGIAVVMEKAGWLENQTRMAAGPRTAAGSVGAMRMTTTPVASGSGCGCGSPRLPVAIEPVAPSCGCATPQAPRRPFSPVRLLKEAYASGKQLLAMFFGFAFIGFFLNGLIPAEWVSAAFGSGRVYGVPLAATLGIPLYVNSEGGLPLIRALLDSGMSQGAAMAFLITGSGTSIGAIAGALAIARWRVVALVVGVLWVGAIATGYGFDALRALGAF
jgi:uncharacterized protein